jgi:hypothetical protein
MKKGEEKGEVKGRGILTRQGKRMKHKNDMKSGNGRKRRLGKFEAVAEYDKVSILSPQSLYNREGSHWMRSLFC